MTVPWDEAGAYLRFSVTYEGEERRIMDELRARLFALGLTFEGNGGKRL